MGELIVFLAGILFITAVLPVSDSVTGLVVGKINKRRAKDDYAIKKIEFKLNSELGLIEGSLAHPIGYNYETDEEEIEFEEQECDGDCENCEEPCISPQEMEQFKTFMDNAEREISVEPIPPENTKSLYKLNI